MVRTERATEAQQIVQLAPFSALRKLQRPLVGSGDNAAQKGYSRAVACHDDRVDTSVRHTHNYYVFCELTPTSHDDLLGSQPTPTSGDEPGYAPTVPLKYWKAMGMGSQTRDVEARVTSVLTSKEVEDAGLGEADQRAPRPDVQPNLA